MTKLLVLELKYLIHIRGLKFKASKEKAPKGDS